MTLLVEALAHILHAQMLACSCGGGGTYSANILMVLGVQGYSWQLALVVLFLVALAHILHVQIATCTVMMVHGGGSGVMEVLSWDSM